MPTTKKNLGFAGEMDAFGLAFGRHTINLEYSTQALPIQKLRKYSDIIEM